MGLAFILAVVVISLWAVWVAWEVSKAGGYPPYQDSARCSQVCDQGRNCDCFQRSCDMTVQEYDNWPFPRGRP